MKAINILENGALQYDLSTATTIDPNLGSVEDVTGAWYNNSYSPFWTKKEAISEDVEIDKDGNRYYVLNSKLYKNNEELFGITDETFKREDFNPDSDLFDIANGKIATAEWNSTNHLFTISYDGTDYTGTVLFNNGVIIHSRIKIVHNKPLLVSLYLDDSKEYKIYINYDGTEYFKPFTFSQRKWTTVSNHPSNSEVTAENQIIQEPQINISEVHDDLIGISVMSNSGQPILATDFSYTTLFLDEDGIYPNIQYNTTSVQTQQTVSENLSVSYQITTGGTSYTEQQGFRISSYSFKSVAEVTNYNIEANPTATPDTAISYNTAWAINDYLFLDDKRISYILDTGYAIFENGSTAEIIINDGYLATYVAQGTDLIEFTTTDTTNTTTLTNSNCTVTRVTYDYIDYQVYYTLTADKTANLGNVIVRVASSGNIYPSFTLESDDWNVGANQAIWSQSYTAQIDGTTAPDWPNIFTPTITLEYRDQSLTANSSFYNSPVAQVFVVDYTILATVSAAVHPNLVGDDGHLYTLAYSDINNTYTVSSWIIPHRADITSYSVSNDIITIEYISDMIFQFQATYTYYKGCSFSIGQGYFRQVSSFGQRGTEQANDKGLDYIFDSNHGVKYMPGILTNNDQYYTDITVDPMPYSNVGSVYQINPYYRLVYQNNLPVGISYGLDSYMGTELVDWASFNGYVIADGTDLYYQDSSGKWQHIWIETASPDIRILENRYIVINTTSYFNCYDIARAKKNHYASDYSHRVIAGAEVYSTALPMTRVGTSGVLASDTTLATSGVNSCYLVTNNGISSIAIGPQAYQRLYKGQETFISSVTPNDTDSEPVDLYYSTTGSYTQYFCSFKVYPNNAIRYIEANLIGINYPVATGAYTLYSPNIFTEYFTTFTNKDSVLNGDTAYSLVYANGTTPILLFSTATQMENVTAVFVIQSQFYAVMDDKIYALTYSNGTLVEQDAIIDITGMQFLGNLPTIAYFYSPMNKSFYSFTGDANLTLLYEATKISEVYLTKYNTATQALYVCTDTGIYVISSLSVFRLPYYGVIDIYFTRNKSSIIKTTDSLITLSYYKQDGLTVKNMYLETKLSGSTNKQNVIISKYRITLANHDNITTGTIRRGCYSFTDKGMAKEEKEFVITSDKWDSLTNTYQFSYTPTLTKGAGLAFFIETPFAVTNITAVIEESNSGAVQAIHNSRS